MTTESSSREFESELAARLPLPGHGSALLPHVVVEGYNTELRRQGRYVGDEAAKRVFFHRLDSWRATLRKTGEDPFGDVPSAELSKKVLDKALKEGSSAAAGILQSAIEDFAPGVYIDLRNTF